MKSGKKTRSAQRKNAKQAPEELEQAMDLPDREVMTLIDPNMLGGGLLGGATGGTASPTDGLTGGSGLPAPQPGTTQNGTLGTGISPLDKFLPSTSQPPGAPYDPSTSASSQT